MQVEPGGRFEIDLRPDHGGMISASLVGGWMTMIRYLRLECLKTGGG
jgi:hypothetical protein